VRDYVTDLQRQYREIEADRLGPLAGARLANRVTGS
jgi:hypothetical protein